MYIFQLMGILLAATSASVLTIMCLKQWKGEKYLCDDCSFNDPESCYKADRPHAVICYAYKSK